MPFVAIEAVLKTRFVNKRECGSRLKLFRLLAQAPDLESGPFAGFFSGSEVLNQRIKVDTSVCLPEAYV